LAIERGAIYTWGAIHWSGARAAGVEDLEQVQRAKTGDPADTDRLQDTVDAVVRWYRDRGYMAVQAGAAASVDEDRSIVTCTVRVEEGERFRFGRLELSGLDSEIAARIRGRWSLRAGDFYDAAYTRRFAAQIREAERAALAGRTGITIRERPDAVATRVDVILEFSKPGGQAGAEPAAGDAPGPGPSATRAVGG
jgi:outer membrane protein assembly factor BamA